MDEAVFSDLEKRLQMHLGTRVKISGKADAGKIEIEYFTAADLDRLIKVFGLPSA